MSRRRLLLPGGGPTGCELTQAFARFRAQVAQIEMAPRLMLREDPEVSELVARRFRADYSVIPRATFVEPEVARVGLNKIPGTIHIDPTLAAANNYAAGAWRKAHAPQTLLAWVERFHAWRRG